MSSKMLRSPDLSVENAEVLRPLYKCPHRGMSPFCCHLFEAFTEGVRLDSASQRQPRVSTDLTLVSTGRGMLQVQSLCKLFAQGLYPLSFLTRHSD
ncbi:hypothetical protein IHE44_0012547 [Lamprotornis superbus]|uniref:Uncharacterized protein n=1 Tax=Lamprotornis superbus TaxID=245042 RepID=A0A835P4N4_9PASS|nr:hypothetical protein IHE44_0012547 [Lamprotornis superbus]